MRIPFLNKGGRTAIDPVCQMKVATPNPPGGKSEYMRKTYYFCGSGCNRVFTKDPESYLSGEKSLEM